ncbi:MAG: ChaN family lipoprotein [Saprospiraceae bacterium]|nr:ChaN family lipoprotein [Saprospiraceae bacterium]
MQSIIRIILSFCLFAQTITGWSQHLNAYQIFTNKGKRTTFKKMVKKLGQEDIVLFGELHDNPIDHWLQLELVKALLEHRNLILGAEMFETDNQAALNNFLQGKIDRLEHDPSIRLWPNYTTDYAPLVHFARDHQLPFIATNVPDRFAKLVYRSGLDTLETFSPEALSFMAPQPMPFDSELKTYKAILELLEHHATPELVMAQALKDATMAHFILENYSSDHLFIHINGTYHSDQYEGILWYLQLWNQDLNYATIATVEQAQTHKLLPENIGLADFIICVDEEMTETH